MTSEVQQLIADELPPVGNCDTKDCVARQILDVLASRWGFLIMRQLFSGTKRNAELRHAIGGISEKMLAQTLRELERVGLISRTSFPVVPPHVEYSLTPLGVTCSKLVMPLLAFIEGNARAFHAAQRAYDERAARG